MQPEGRLTTGTPRAREVLSWLDEHGGRGRPFVILDDNDALEPLTVRLIQTDFDTGLTCSLADRAAVLLRRA